MYCKPLTKQELQDAGIINVYKRNGQWVVLRCWYRGSEKTKSFKEISITQAKRKHKYRPDKYYPKVTFCVNQKRYSIPLSRLLYVWFVEDITEPGYQVDHLDNNPYNNEIDNLQLLTIEENLAKRFVDNPEAWTNQWGKPKEW